MASGANSSTPPVVAWRNNGLCGVQASHNASHHLGTTTFTDVQTCMGACLATDGCEAISYARCGTSKLSKPSKAAATTGNTTCGPNLGNGDVGLAKECNLWSQAPSDAVRANASPTGPPFHVSGTVSTVFAREPLSNGGVFVVMEGVPQGARDLLPNCQFVAGSGVCGSNQVNECVKYEQDHTPNACDGLKVVGFGSPTVTYAAALAAAKSHPPDASAVGFVMDGASRMYALMGKGMADATGNVTLVSGPATMPTAASVGERTNTYFTYLRAMPATSGANKGKLVVKVNGTEVVVAVPHPGMAWYWMLLIALAAVLVAAVFAWGVFHAVSARKLHRTQADTALHSGMATLDFIAHPDKALHMRPLTLMSPPV